MPSVIAFNSDHPTNLKLKNNESLPQLTSTCAVDDLNSRFLVLTNVINVINHFCYLTHSNTAFDDKGGIHCFAKTKLILVLFLQNSDSL